MMDIILDLEQFDALSLEFLEYIDRAYSDRNFEASKIEDFFQRGLNANAYRIECDDDEQIVVPLLSEIFWIIQGQNDDYYGEWIVTILNMFVTHGLDTTLLGGEFITSVLDGLCVSTTTTHIFEAIQKLLDLGISTNAVENAITIFESEAADLYVPFGDISAAKRFDEVVEILKEYKNTLI